MAAKVEAAPPEGKTFGISQAPQLREPSDGLRLSSMGPVRLAWDNPAGATQYQVQVIPFNNDGPAVNLIRNLEPSFTVEPPTLGRGPYVMLPDMTYAWRVRVTDQPTFAAPEDPSWGPWAERRFKTPRITADTIRPQEPCLGCTATSLNPTLVWANDNPFIFWYEIQASKDATFNSDPQTGTAPVFYNLAHAGESHPLSSWAVPESTRLDPGTRYYWRVRPRVQGDGAPVNWPVSFYFDTPMVLPVDLAVSDVSVAPTTVQPGQSVTVEYTIRNQGSGSAPATQSRALLCPSARISKICTDLGATDAVPALGPNSAKVRTMAVAIPSGTAPGTYYIGVYADFLDAVAETNETNNGAGTPLLVQAPPAAPSPAPTPAPSPSPAPLPTPAPSPTPAPPSVPTPSPSPTPAPAQGLSIGPITFGTLLFDTTTCTVLGSGPIIPYGTFQLYGRFDYSGSGTITASWYWNGLKVLDTAPAALARPSGCNFAFLFSNTGLPLPSGSYRLDLLSNGQLIRSGNVIIA